jgi:hypothetical protein
MKQISHDWWISLDATYKERESNGSLVLWRPERTIWINIWSDADRGTPRQRLDYWTHDRHEDATDLFAHDEGNLLRFGYLLEEPEDEGGRRLGLYSYTVAPSSTVQMACYYDLEEDTGWAEAVSRSLCFGGPDAAREVEEAVGANGHLVLASVRVIGPDRAAVLSAFREPGANDQDSGWRFFRGDEDEAFAAEPDSIALCPLSSLLGLDPSLRVIINSPPGSAWHRASRSDPWEPCDATREGDGNGDGWL